MDKLLIIADRLKEPLSEASAKSKKNLLLISFASLLVTKLGLMPTKFTMLGITLQQANQNALLLAILIATIYFLTVFIISIVSDLLSWQLLFAAENEKMLLNLKDFDISQISQESVLEQMKMESNLTYKSKIVFLMRILIDLIIPISFSGYGMFLLISAL